MNYPIMEFKNLCIILCRDRIAYKNTSTMENFIIHRRLLIALNQFIFSLIFYFNAGAIYNDF